MNRRGEQTHARLLDAATRLFSERGFDGVTTREVASAAGTTLPAIAHHFGSKQGMYDAVLAAIGHGLDDRLAPAVRSANAALSLPRMTRRQAITALQDLVSTHARAVLSGRADLVALIVREQLRPIDPQRTARERMFETRLLGPVMQIVGFLRGLPPESEPVKLQTLMLTGRVLSFRVLRRASLRLLNWKRFEHKQIEAIVAALCEEIDSMFATPSRAAAHPPLIRRTHSSGVTKAIPRRSTGAK